MTFDADDKKYIDQALEKNRTQFRDEMEVFFHELTEEHKSHMTALKEGFQADMKALSELIQDRPAKNEVREMIQEEIQGETRPIKMRLTQIEGVLAI